MRLGKTKEEIQVWPEINISTLSRNKNCWRNNKILSHREWQFQQSKSSESRSTLPLRNHLPWITLCKDRCLISNRSLCSILISEWLQWILTIQTITETTLAACLMLASKTTTPKETLSTMTLITLGTKGLSKGILRCRSRWSLLEPLCHRGFSQRQARSQGKTTMG